MTYKISLSQFAFFNPQTEFKTTLLEQTPKKGKRINNKEKWVSSIFIFISVHHKPEHRGITFLIMLIF